MTSSLIDRLQATNPYAEIWWDSSPLVFQAWREEILLKEARVITLADLGYGVLDTAMVETAAYVIQKVSEL